MLHINTEVDVKKTRKKRKMGIYRYYGVGMKINWEIKLQ